MTSENTKSQPPNWGLVFIICAITWFVLFFLEAKYKLLSAKTFKSNLWKLYGVSNDTFNKWVKFFASDLIPYEEYLGKRKLTFLEVLILIGILGVPEKLALVMKIKSYPSLRKQDIVSAGEGSYHTLKSCVNEYNEAFIVSPEAYASLSKFPPNISLCILDAYG